MVYYPFRSCARKFKRFAIICFLSIIAPKKGAAKKVGRFTQLRLSSEQHSQLFNTVHLCKMTCVKSVDDEEDKTALGRNVSEKPIRINFTLLSKFVCFKEVKDYVIILVVFLLS